MDHRDLRADPVIAAPRPSSVHQFPQHRQPADRHDVDAGNSPRGQGLAQARRAATSATRNCRSSAASRRRRARTRINLRRRGRPDRRRPPQAQPSAHRRRHARAHHRAADLGRRTAPARRSTRRSGPCVRRSTSAATLIGNVLAALQRIGRNPPPGDAGDAGRRAAIGALGNPVRRGVAGDAPGRRGGSPPICRRWRRCARKSRPNAPTSKRAAAPWPKTTCSSRS